jgi:flagellar M-ring protein FliF
MEHALQNLLSLWSNFSLQRRIVIVGATVAMFAAIVAMTRVGSQPSMSLLYAGLENAAAGEVIAALEQQGAAFEVRGNAIYVADSIRDNLRMTLAGQGLPAAGSAGYELLDNLSGFGTTSQMFDAAYWRAKEGELARTVQANPAIRSARVHIATAPDTPFQDAVQPSASVTITTVAGGLRQEQAQALRHLVAAAVPGLQPKDVALIDSVAGLLPFEEADPALGPTSHERAATLKANLERLLEARVGDGKVVVEVAIDVETAREEITERRFDPTGRVAISSETEERSDSSGQSEAGVTVASNLPDGDAGSGTSEQSQSSETRERVNYEVSETSRALLRTPGGIRKISVAVLLDAATVTAADGTVTQEPRSEEEIATLRELVASAMGLDESRGDVLTVKSLAFQPIVTIAQGTEATATPWFGPIDLMRVIQVAVLAVVTLVLGLFVLRPMLMTTAPRQAQIGSGPRPLALPAAQGLDALENSAGANVLTGELQDDFSMPQMASAWSIGNDMDLGNGLSDTEPSDDHVARLRRLIETRQTESIEILRGWMEKEEEAT